MTSLQNDYRIVTILLHELQKISNRNKVVLNTNH